MRVYRVSPILQYSPFFRLTYFSKFDFEVGNICEIDFNKRKLKAVVVEILELNDAKVEIRKGNFATKKIETKLDKLVEGRFTREKFNLIQAFADKFLLPVGEVIFALDNLYKQNKFKIFFNKAGKILDEIIVEDFNLEKYTQYQAPHISQIHLLILYLKVFEVKAQLTLRTTFLGTNEKYFLETEDFEGIKINVEEGGSVAQKYIYNKSQKKFKKNPEGEEVATNQDRVLDDEILKVLETSKERKEKTFIFVLAHGYHSAIFCKDCKSGYACDKCGHNFSILNEQEDTIGEDGLESLHSKRYLFCKNCENKKPLKDDQYLICRKCGSWGLFPYGDGTQKVYEELGGGSDILFIDESKKKLSNKKLKDQVQNWLTSQENSILLGTKRVLEILKAILDDNKTDTLKPNTIAVNMSPLASGKNFDSDEKFIKLLSDLETVSNKIYIGKQDNHDSVLDRYKHKEDFICEELELRKKFNLPPYSNVLSFIFEWRSKKIVDKYLNSLKPARETKKGNKLIYHFILSSEEIKKNRLRLEYLRQFGVFLISGTMYENFIKRK